MAQHRPQVAGEKELSELEKYCTSCRAVVVGVAGFQLVVQALHQLILCSGCDYLHASLHVAQHSFSLVRRGESRPPRYLGPAGRSSACPGVRLELGQSHRVQAPGEGARRAIDLRLDSEARL